jgi:ADP-heptose:LPS heptosyltransferase
MHLGGCSGKRSLDIFMTLLVNRGYANVPLARQVVREKVKPGPIWRQYIGLNELLSGNTAPEPVIPLLSLTDRGRDYAQNQLERYQGRPIVCIAPGTMVAAKRWPSASFAEVQALRRGSCFPLWRTSRIR